MSNIFQLPCDPNKLAAMIAYDPYEMAPSFPPQTSANSYDMGQASPPPYDMARVYPDSSQTAPHASPQTVPHASHDTQQSPSVAHATGVSNAPNAIHARNAANAEKLAACALEKRAAISATSSNTSNASNAASTNIQNVIPLRSASMPCLPFPVDALGPFAPTVETLSRAMKVPEAMAASSVLTALAFCAQGIANVRMRDGRTIPLSLYCLTIADSGDRKTAVDSVVYQAIKDVEREQVKAYRDELQVYTKEKDKYERRPKKEKELFSFDLEPPKNPAMLLENANTEGLFRTFQEGRPSLALFSDEGGTLFGGHAFQKENALKSITFFSKLWDGSPVDKVRSGEGFNRLYDKRLSMHLMLQPAVAETVLADELFQGQGFLPRFLFSWPESMKGSRHYDECNVRDDATVQDLYYICSKLLSIPLQIDESMDALILRNLTLDRDAHDIWVKHHNMIEELLGPKGPLNNVYANASKCAEQTIRIAGVLTLAGNLVATTIPKYAMEDAIAISQWYLKEVRRLRERNVTPPEIMRAEKLLTWLKDKGHKQFCIRLIAKKGPSAVRLKKRAEEAVRILEDHGFVRRGHGRATIDGVGSATFWEFV